MLWGFPYSIPWGDHDDMISSLKAVDIRDGARVSIVPADNCGQYFRLVVDGLAQGTPLYVPTGQLAEIVGLYEATSSGHLINVCPQGDWNTSDVDLTSQVQPFASGHARYFFLALEPTFTLFSEGDDGQLSGWALTGFQRYANVAPVNYRTNWGRVEFELTDASGVRSVVLSLRGTTLASGDLTGDGACTLSAVASGVTGSVTITYTGNCSGSLYVIWPAKYAIHYQGSGWTGADFPRTPLAYVYDDGSMQTGTYRSPALSGATWYIVAHQVDDNANESTGLMSGGVTAVIPGTPMPCTSIAYVTGDASATTISWTYGTGATGANVYDSLSGGSGMDLHTPNYTVSNSGLTLTGISTGYSGYRYVIVRGILAGIDDGAGVALEIQYSGGSVLLPRPPDVGLGNDIEVDGRTLTLRASMNIADNTNLPTGVELYAWLTTGGTGGVDYSAPISTTAVSTGANRAGADLIVTIAGTVSGDGEYYYSARARTAGGAYSLNAPARGPIRLSTVKPAQPSAITLRAGA